MSCRLFAAGEQPVGSIRSCRFSAASLLDGLIARPDAGMLCRRCAATGRPIDRIRSFRCPATGLVVGWIVGCRHAAASPPDDRFRWVVFQNRSVDVLIDRWLENAVCRTGHAARSVDPD